MDSLLKLILLPLLAAGLSLLKLNPALSRGGVSLIFWSQFAYLIYLLEPVLLGKIKVLTLVPGIAADKIGALFALLTTLVVATAMTHACFFFQNESQAEPGSEEHVRIFYFSASLLLMAMTFVCFCDNLGYLWIAIEGTTLASAALVFHSRTKHSLEATWKYLIICSVGIAFALFGTILIFASSQQAVDAVGTLEISGLMAMAPKLNYSLLRLGFVFCLLGYGTKAGIFPLHSWLPDAHSEAPAPGSAMLSGGLLNCALLAIFRLSQIVLSAGHENLALKLPLVMGVLSVLAASLFLVRQSGIKRLWAYSSIENVGIILCAIGLNAPALFFLLALNHSLAKTAIFLLSGNIIQVCGSKQIHDIKGVLANSPVWAMMLAVSAFAVTGAPPFGAFVSEWGLLALCADKGYWWVVASLLMALALSFVVVSYHVSRCIWGTPAPTYKTLKQLPGAFFPALLIISTLLAGTTALTQKLVLLP
ncbi:MAG: hypothetical protein K2X27_23995 [Candidatus Obscuribacterales bacterium]|nr:hypothetical protein [Candidatus Obscuribacterales bacterium]